MIDQGGESWIQLAGLIVTIVGATGSSTAFIMGRINKIKDETNEKLDTMELELNASRMAAYKEYVELRKEITDVGTIARKEFGETVAAIREKVTEVELWVRDQLTETRHTLKGAIDMRHQMVDDKFEKTDDRMRQLELFSASKHGYAPKD
jgi:hypothetical protein